MLSIFKDQAKCASILSEVARLWPGFRCDKPDAGGGEASPAAVTLMNPRNSYRLWLDLT